jgi:deoxyribodipyrimidine photolyase-related protein
MKTLRLILGDQLNHLHSWFLEVDQETHYVMMETRQETDYVRHHIQKVIGIFIAMRAFADELEAAGHNVHYLKINDPQNQQTLSDNLFSLVEVLGIERFEYLEPDEYRLDQQLNKICKSLSIPSKGFSSEHFLTERDELKIFFQGKKTYLMESFYRHLRKKHNVLIDGKDPVGGQWNFDASNRKSFPKGYSFPSRSSRQKDISGLLAEIQNAEIQTIGKVNETLFRWPVTRQEAIHDLKTFCQEHLSRFGDYQDAMDIQAPFGHHSLISFALNVKLLHPMEVIRSVLDEWNNRADEIPISSVEGYIRQILGWREYMRGVYWTHMPDYNSLNELNHQNKLPGWFWTGETNMNCLKHAINQSLDHAYAHHIQRLMITGNFGLLVGIHPDEMDQWYLGMYIDAIEWVEITNTRGMSQYADGGIVGTKPYVSSANYIDKMSNYCKGCHYDKKLKVGDKACPFNSLYWHFFDRNRDKLETNPRIGMAYRTWDRMDDNKKLEIINQAEVYLQDLDSL